MRFIFKNIITQEKKFLDARNIFLYDLKKKFS